MRYTILTTLILLIPIGCPRSNEQSVEQSKVEYPQLSAIEIQQAEQLLDQLKNKSEDVDLLTKKILSMECGVLPVLFKYSHETDNIDFRSIIVSMINHFGELNVRGWTNKQKIGVNESFPVEFRIRNDFPIPVSVLPSLDGSDYGRYPKYTIKVFDSNDKQVEIELPGRCGNMNGIEVQDFIELLPGEECNPCGTVTSCNSYSGRVRKKNTIDQDCAYYHVIIYYWKPSKPGAYSIQLTYDVGPESIDWWFRTLSRRKTDDEKKEIYQYVYNMPWGKYESNKVQIVVE